MPSFCGQSNTVSMRLILEGCCILYGARTCTKKNQTTMFSLLYILTHSTLYGNNFSSHTNHFTKEFQIYIYTWCTGLFWTCHAVLIQLQKNTIKFICDLIVKKNLTGARLWSSTHFCMVEPTGVWENLISASWFVESRLLEGLPGEDTKMWGYLPVKINNTQ